ncbi:hypothetical protein ACFL2T_00255 [Elusimicrobiota bacterium]
MSPSYSDEDFIALWHRADLSVVDVAERLGVSPQAANKRARKLGLPKKRRRTGAMRLRAQLIQTAAPLADGQAVPGAPWLTDPEVAPLCRTYWQTLQDARTAQDLYSLRPLQLRLCAVLAFRYPQAEALYRDLADMAKILLQSQRVEADMPTRSDPVHLRQEAARQMMIELGSVLTREEQETMSRLIRVGAERMARKNGQSLIGARMPVHPENVGAAIASCSTSGPSPNTEVAGGNGASGVPATMTPPSRNPW